MATRLLLTCCTLLILFGTYSVSAAQGYRTAAEVTILVTEWCSHCRALEKFLQTEKIRYKRFDIEKSAKGRIMYQQLGELGLPTIIIDGQVLIGFNKNDINRTLRR